MKKPAFLLCLFMAFNWSYAQNYKFGKVSIKELQETKSPQNAEANASLLYVNQNTYYTFKQNDGFIKVTEIYKRIKIYNKEGFDWATAEVSLRNNESKNESLMGLKAVTYNLENKKIAETKLKNDGKFDERNNKYWSTEKFTMPNIKEGCVIEYKYSIVSPFMSIEDINLQYDIPVKKLDISVRIPEYFNFNKYVNPRASFSPKMKDHIVTRSELFNGSISGVGNATNLTNIKWDFREIKTEIKLSDIPALKKEKFVSNLNTYRTKLIWEYAYSKDLKGKITNYSTTWDDVTKTIYDYNDFGPELKLNDYFKSEVASLINGITDESEKMNLIYSFVKSKVKWNNLYGYTTDNGVEKAYREGSGNVGDINLMLTAMLKYAKIKANPMLISTRSNDIPLYPSTSAFNYVVAAVELPDDVIVLDATDKFAAPNVLPLRAVNWKGRIIRKYGGSNWYDLNPKEAVKELVSLNAIINDDLSIDGKVRSQITLFAAKNFRTKYQNFNSEELEVAVEKDKGEIEVSNYEITDKDLVDHPIGYEYDYHLESAIEQIGDKIFLTPMLFFAPKENPFKLDKRAYPIDFIYAINDKYQVNMIIPDGYVLESMPESTIVHFNGNAGEFKYIANENGKMLQFLITLDLNQSFILPKEYNDFKQFYQVMTEKQMEKIVLKKV